MPCPSRRTGPIGSVIRARSATVRSSCDSVTLSQRMISAAAPEAMMLRNLWCARLKRSEPDEFVTEVRGLELLDMAVLRRGALDPVGAARQGSDRYCASRPMRCRKARAHRPHFPVSPVPRVSPDDRRFHLQPCVARTACLCALTRSSTVKISRPSRSMPDSRATAISRRGSATPSVARQLRCGTVREPTRSPNCARS